MVKERVVTQYLCELCQREFLTREAAEDCESRCHRLAESPGLEVLNLSTRTFNALNCFGLYAVGDVAQMSDQALHKIKGLGDGCLKEVKARLVEYGIEESGANDPKPISTKDSRLKKKAISLKPLLNFNPPCLTDMLKEQLVQFVGSLDWPRQYSQYTHDDDSWEKGFHAIAELERGISEHLTLGYLTRKDIVKIARWESPHTKDRMKCPGILRLNVNENNDSEIEKILRLLEVSVKGTRTLFLTTIMRFISPSRMGLLDANLVRAFGVGDSNINSPKWLNLAVRKTEDSWFFAGNWWSWPNEYYRWNLILGFLAFSLNERGITCPHPNGFLEKALRQKGTWICADVEMALSSYASEVISLSPDDYSLSKSELQAKVEQRK